MSYDRTVTPSVATHAHQIWVKSQGSNFCDVRHSCLQYLCRRAHPTSPHCSAHCLTSAHAGQAPRPCTSCKEHHKDCSYLGRCDNADPYCRSASTCCDAHTYTQHQPAGAPASKWTLIMPLWRLQWCLSFSPYPASLHTMHTIVIKIASCLQGPLPRPTSAPCYFQTDHSQQARGSSPTAPNRMPRPSARASRPPRPWTLCVAAPGATK